MGYQASKTSFRKIGSLFLAGLVILSYLPQTLSAVTITDTHSVSVSALVTDPNATSSTSTPPFSGGGGGFSSGVPSFTDATETNSILISGKYVPKMTVEVLSSGNVLSSIVVPDSGEFSLKVSHLKSGVYSLLLTVSDPSFKDKQYQSSLSYTVYVSDASETYISDVIFPPLFSPVKTSFKLGSLFELYGKALPQSSIIAYIDGKKIGTTVSASDGTFLVKALTEKVGKRSLVFKYGAPLEAVPSGKTQTITVYSQNSKDDSSRFVCGSRVDFSLDCRINIVDFSVLAYWYKRSNFPEKYDLNGDGKIDIKDFSIMAYHWTG